jgi:hypothetical protein
MFPSWEFLVEFLVFSKVAQLCPFDKTKTAIVDVGVVRQQLSKCCPICLANSQGGLMNTVLMTNPAQESSHSANSEVSHSANLDPHHQHITPW